MCWKWMAIVCAVWTQLTGAAINSDNCSHRVLKEEEKMCIDKYNLKGHIMSGLPLLLFGERLDHFCEFSPQAASCIQEVFEPCRDPYYDYKAYNKTFSKVCDNKLLYMQAESFCSGTTTIMESCFTQYKANVRKLARHQLSEETRCMILNTLRDCLSFDVLSDCKPEYSSYLTSLYQGRFSSEMCDVYTNLHSKYLVIGQNSTDDNLSTIKRQGQTNANSSGNVLLSLSSLRHVNLEFIMIFLSISYLS